MKNCCKNYSGGRVGKKFKFKNKIERNRYHDETIEIFPVRYQFLVAVSQQRLVEKSQTRKTILTIDKITIGISFFIKTCFIAMACDGTIFLVYLKNRNARFLPHTYVMERIKINRVPVRSVSRSRA